MALFSPGVMPRLATYYFCYFTFIGIFMPYFALLLQGRGFAATEIALLMSVMQVMRLVAPNLWGWLGDRLGRSTPIIRASALLSLLGFIGVRYAHDLWSMLFALGVMSFFWTATMPLLEALTLASLGARSAHYGRVRAWGSIGFVVAVIAMGVALERLPVDSILSACMLTLSTILLASWCLPEQVRVSRVREGRAGLGKLLCRPEIVALLLAAFLMSAAHGAFYVFFSIHLVESGYTKTSVGLLWSLGVLAEIAVFLWAPKLLGRHSLRHVMFVCFGATILRFLLTGWGAQWWGLILLAQCLHGITFGAYHATAVAAVHRWFGEGHQSLGQALYGSMSFGAGGIVGGLLSGVLWEHFGAGWTFTAGSLFALLGLGCLLLGWRRGGPAQSGVYE